MYPSDLKDDQWNAIEHYFERSDPRGAVSKHSKRVIVNAIIYVIRTGVQWRMLPKDMPPWQTVYNHFYRLQERGVWDQVLVDMNKVCRIQVDRNPNPSYALIDAQSVKIQYRGNKRGFDGGKKIKGRKRHVCTGSMGHLLYVKVHSASIHDTIAGCDVAYQAFRNYSSIRAFCADQGYRGTTKIFVEESLKMRIDITKKLSDQGFNVIPVRWVVERFFAWLGNFRRLAKDYELLTSCSEQVITIAAIIMLLNRHF